MVSPGRPIAATSIRYGWIYMVAHKSKPLPNDQKIVLKHVNEIRFIRQIKV